MKMASNATSIQCLHSSYFTLIPTPTIDFTTALTCFLTAILSITGVTANGLVCGAILTNRELQIYSNMLLLVLSFNDFLVAFVTQPLYIVRRILESQHRYICWVTLTYRSLWSISVGISFLVVTMISCERCFALFQPFKYKLHVSVLRLLVSTLVLSGLWVLFVLSRYFGLSTNAYYYITITLILTCIIVITVAHVKIFKLARRHHLQISMTRCSINSNELPSTSNAKIEKKRRHDYSAREAKIAKSTAFVVGAVFLCYFPLMGSLITSTLVKHEVLFHYHVFPWTDILVFLNSLLNPLIYCWRSRELRLAISRLLQGVRKKPRACNTFISRTVMRKHQQQACKLYTH